MQVEHAGQAEKAEKAEHAADWCQLSLEQPPVEGTIVCAHAKGREFALHCLSGGEVCVTDSVCTHEYARLCDGWLIDDVLVCPLHGGQFDVRTGAGLSSPIERPLRTYPVRRAGEAVFIRLDAEAPPAARRT
ncbi:MAG: Rieske 2Fe-2S domain-containing protein [Burkholderiaceae bacterium]